MTVTFYLVQLNIFRKYKIVFNKKNADVYDRTNVYILYSLNLRKGVESVVNKANRVEILLTGGSGSVTWTRNQRWFHLHCVGVLLAPTPDTIQPNVYCCKPICVYNSIINYIHTQNTCRSQAVLFASL